MRRIPEFLTAVALAIPFTIALTYATLWIPTVVIHRLLLGVFPDYWWPPPSYTVWLRPLGYISFAATLTLIWAGLVTKRMKVAASGSIAMFLPTFGYFASTMFFLAGIGVLRVLWFPWFDVSPNILRLGDVVYLPYILLSLLVAPLAWVTGVSPAAMNTPLSVMIMMSGIMVFLIGVVTWLYGRFTDVNIMDFWIYRYSRHPQYLGYLLWSYGLLLLTTFLGAPMGGHVPPPSLPWLISALTIIGVSLHEEDTMTKKYGEEYLRYRGRTPFMLSLPKQLSAVIVAPAKALLKKNWAQNRKEIVTVTMVYSVILCLLSLPSILFL